MLDYLVIGLGLAGVSFCETLDKHHKTFVVVSDNSQTSSVVAGGLYNPVILKRFTMAWMAQEQLVTAMPFYLSLEKKLGARFAYEVPVLRRFASVEEQNLWFEAMDKNGLNEFLSPNIHTNTNPNIDAPNSLGEVVKTGRIDTETLITSFEKQLTDRSVIRKETFDHNLLKVTEGHIEYKSLKAKQIVFAEGYGMKNNPYFNYLPLIGTKGEYVIIYAPELKEESCIKSAIFCIPLGKDIYKVGANYERSDKTSATTQKAKDELLKKLDDLIKCDYMVVDQVAGIRPTVTDRRPLVGQHPDYKSVYVLNGFGSHGVMIAPFAAQQLFNAIENHEKLHPEMDIRRFDNRYKA
ncbi:MAG: FAD-dependent oxidoreductase [Flavobacteriaceae bacterium]